jgi:CDP-glycerol glycerophosphotransferase (TagB/SpsB family)/glycosyltransferase involved in cell wall biosynthesis
LRRAPLVPGTVLYESFAGHGMGGNPEAIFRALLAAPDMSHLQHVWAIASAGRLPAEFADDARVRFVVRDSPEYDAALATSTYLVNDTTFPALFAKRPGQTYLNTWHGSALSAFGQGVRRGAAARSAIMRDLASADYVLAPNEDTVQMYLSAYGLQNIFRGRIIVEGTPRIDRQFVTDGERSAIRARLGTSADQRLILYAPTGHGAGDDMQQLRKRVRALSERIDTDRYHLLLKLHPQVYQFAADDAELRRILVPDDLPANQALAAADALITDRSSIFVDFLVTGRPILFHSPDADPWPGPVCRDVDELAIEIAQLGPPDDAYEAARARLCPREDGHAAERVIDIVFRGASAGYDVRDGFRDGRPRVLVHLDALDDTAATTAALSLLDSVDHDRFDMTVSVPDSSDSELTARINPKVRQVRRRGTPPSRADQDAETVRDEWSRCFGDAQFDHLADFSGTSPWWGRVLLCGGGPLSVWLRTEVRTGGGRRQRTDEMMTVYEQADRLVSVSRELADINRAALAERIPAERFTVARNTVDAERTLRLAYGVRTPRSSAAGSSTGRPTTLPAGIDALLAHYSLDDIRAEVERRTSIDSLATDLPGLRTFVTVGQLSPEKNHRRLIRAFDAVHQDDPNTRLLVLGGGRLEESLQAYVIDRGLGSAVVIAGALRNPYAVMARADCFVLSGDVETQPTVVLEALVLGLPVVTTDVASVRGALPDGYGRVVARTDRALADGMRAFLRGELKPREFDYVAYNREAVEEFYRAIGAVKPQG